jgi:hypothetical protein
MIYAYWYAKCIVRRLQDQNDAKRGDAIQHAALLICCRLNVACSMPSTACQLTQQIQCKQSIWHMLCRIAAGEELLPVSHLLARQAPEVPSHVKAGLQHTLQGVPVSEYSPLDHHSGAMDRLAVRPCSVKTTFACTLHDSCVWM